MFLMRLKPGTGWFIAYLRIWLWKTCSRMVCARIMVQNEFEINSVWVPKMQARTAPKGQTSSPNIPETQNLVLRHWNPLAAHVSLSRSGVPRVLPPIRVIDRTVSKENKCSWVAYSWKSEEPTPYPDTRSNLGTWSESNFSGETHWYGSDNVGSQGPYVSPHQISRDLSGTELCSRILVHKSVTRTLSQFEAKYGFGTWNLVRSLWKSCEPASRYMLTPDFKGFIELGRSSEKSGSQICDRKWQNPGCNFIFCV